MADDIVYTARTNKVYHLDEDCSYLNNSLVREIDIELAEAWGIDKCQRCAGTKIDNAPENKCERCLQTFEAKDLLPSAFGMICESCFKQFAKDERREARRKL